MMEFVAAAWSAYQAYSGPISLITSIGSGLMQMSQANEQAEGLRFQGQMALLQGQERSLQYQREELNAKRQAEATLERLARANAAARARAPAMNISPMSGSVLNLQAWNDREAGDEWQIAQDNAAAMAGGAKNALAAGQAQAAQYKAAAKSTQSGGLLKGLFSIGAGIGNFASLGGPPNPVSSFSYENNFDNGWMMRAASR